MKPVTPDCIVLYSASSCLFYDSHHSFHKVDTLLNETSAISDIKHIAKLQSQLDGVRLEQKRFALIVVPDDWLSISEHTLDHIVPKQLAPLAALAFAAESTFSSPETLWFRYRLVRDHKTSNMQVMACAQSLAEQVCKPFHDRGMRCCLVSSQQWQAYLNKKFGLWRIAQQGLLPFDPEMSKRRHHRVIWSCFAAACLLLQSGLMMHDHRLSQELDGLEQQSRLYSRSLMLAAIPSSRLFLEKVLAKTQVLSASVRLSSFKSDAHSVQLVMSLPNTDIKPLLARWHQEEPSWRLMIDKKPQSKSMAGSDKEVMDVVVSISSI